MASKKTSRASAPRGPSAGKQAASERFEGFADLRFFDQLAANQSREWFAEHKSEYEEGFARPMLAFLGEVRAKLDRVYPDCELAEPKVFRIHRDVRFAADKSPYKTHVAGLLAVKRGASKATETPAALYLHLGVDGNGKRYERFGAAGLYMMDAPQLARFREAVMDDARGREVGKLVGALEKAGYRMEAAASLKSAPRGIDPEHPRVELLKRKGLIAMFPALPANASKSRAFLDGIVEHAKKAAPLVRWLTFTAG